MPDSPAPSSSAASLAATPAQQFQQLCQQGRRPDVRLFLAAAGDLLPAQVAAVLLADQRERWCKGQRVPAEAYLELFPYLRDDFEYAVEIIYGEWLLREEEGEPPDLAGFASRFPAFAERLKIQVELHRAIGALGHTSHSQQSTGPGSATPLAPAGPDSTTWPSPPDHQITGQLGQGGMGVVYRAVDVARQRVVAVKTLRRLDPAALYRLKQEFRALAEVSHPNLVHFHEMLSDGQQWFLSMELIEGANFLAHVRPASACPPAPTVDPLTAEAMAFETTQHHNAVDLVRLRAALLQLATGLAALHEMGKLHRDIKPTNVLVAADGRVVLLDFGLAGELDTSGQHLSGEGHIAGTAAYMSPEQAAGLALTPASDWYSVGVVLYQALTGQLPFRGNALRVLQDKQQGEPVPPSALAQGTPEDLDQLCAALLRRLPQARPSGTEVLQRLGGAQSERALSVPAATASQRVFVGRASHLTALREAFEVSRRGRAVTVLVQGRSGAGKSLLVQHFLAGLLDRSEAVVLAGKCYERESVPYKAMDSLVDALSRYLARLPLLEAQALLPRDVHLLARTFPVLQRTQAVAEAPGQRSEVADPREAHRRSFAALRELLGRLADRRPLVLFIDDLQWGDVDSAAQLAELWRPADAPPLLFLGCYRSEDAAASPCLRLILGEKTEPANERREVTVEPLSEAEARELALTLMATDGPAREARAEAIARESAGNPFFIHVLAQQFTGESEPSEQSPASAGGLALDRLLWARVQTLPAETRRLLEIIAVSGQPLTQREAFVAAGLRPAEDQLLGPLRSWRLIRSVGPTPGTEIETYHDRIREAVLAHLPAPTRQEHHRQLAGALEQAAGQPADFTPDALAEYLKNQDGRRLFALAYHFDAAGDSVRALPYALVAAETARARHALEIAEQQYKIAARGSALATEGARYRIARGLGQVLMFAGRYAEAEPQFLAAGVLAADDVERAHVEGELGDLAFKRGDFQAANKAFERALRLLGQRVPRWGWLFGVLGLWEVLVQVGHTYCPGLFLARRPLDGAVTDLKVVSLCTRLAQAYWFLRSKVACFWTHLRAMNLAERYPPTIELARVYASHGPAMSMLPLFGRGIAYTEKALAIHETVDDLWGKGQALEFAGMTLHAASRWQEAIEKSRAAIALLKQTGDPWQLNCSNYQIAVCLYRLGDLGGASEQARRLHEDARANDPLFAGISLSVSARASRGQVPPEIIRAEMERPSDDPQRTAQVWHAEAMRLLAADQAQEAAELLERALELVRQGRIRNTYVSFLGPWLATSLRLASQQAGTSSQSQALLRRASVAARSGLRLARSFQNDLPHALRESAYLAALRGRTRRARKLLDEGLAVAQCQGARYEHAQTLLARGEIGLRFGWPGAEAEVADAGEALRKIEVPGSAPVAEGLA